MCRCARGAIPAIDIFMLPVHKMKIWSQAFVWDFHKRGQEQFPWKMAMLALQWGHRGWSVEAAVM